MDQLGAVAGKQYQGDGLSVIATAEGASLRCAFQRLEGQVTREGLWLSSTTDNNSGERFRVMAMEVGRVTSDFAPLRRDKPCAPSDEFGFNDIFRSVAVPGHSDATIANAYEQSTPSLLSMSLRPRTGALHKTGIVKVTDNVARFIRPGLTEEYTVSVDGVRQDFIIEQRPEGDGELRVELDVTGAKAEPLVNGARLVLDGSGRKLAYNRLRVTDATGRELPARMEVAPNAFGVGGAHPAARNLAANHSRANLHAMSESAGLEATALRQARMPAATTLAVLVDDAAAIYPLRIDPTFSDADWISMGGIPGANSAVYAAAVDELGNLYIGGDFTAVGDVFANRVAKWDGNTWSALGSGLSYTCNALATDGTNLYAGGTFWSAGEVGASGIARWNGVSWSALGSGVNDSVWALTIFGDYLIVGGRFTMAGGSPAKYVARWDGNAWLPLGAGMNNWVIALTSSDTNLYAGGLFTTAGGNIVNKVARWDGFAWSALGTGITNDDVRALVTSSTDLFAGTSSGVRKWNGTSWANLGLNGIVQALTMVGTNLYAGGFFQVSGASSHNIAKWNGTNWIGLSTGIGNGSWVYAVVASGTNLFVGGSFTTAGGSTANRIANWDGSKWSPVSSGLNGPVYAVAMFDTNLYVGGAFDRAGSFTLNRVARWDGSVWTGLGVGMNSTVRALAVIETNLYAGGDFTSAGGLMVNRIARWNGTSWSGFINGLSGGLNPSVHSLAVSGTNLYVGGLFTSAGSKTVNNVARWNGFSWSELETGVNAAVMALAVSGNDLFVGGSFTNASGSAANRIAKWDGTAWSALGVGVNSNVMALTKRGPHLVVGGAFTMAGANPASYIATWNGNSWASLGQGLNSSVNALAVSGTDLYVGGNFSRATNSGNGIVVNCIAKWDGALWSPLGSGVNNAVRAMLIATTNIYLGGDFTVTGSNISAFVAGAKISAAAGRFDNLSFSEVAGFSCTFLDASVGQPYRIQTSPSLAAGSWTDYTNFTYTAPIVITVPIAGNTNRFFRAITP